MEKRRRYDRALMEDTIALVPSIGRHSQDHQILMLTSSSAGSLCSWRQHRHFKRLQGEWTWTVGLNGIRNRTEINYVYDLKGNYQSEWQ